jgi:hypothetical protein
VTVAAPQTLEVAEGITFGIEYVTKTAAILAQRRKGKTYTGSVIAEELCDAGLPWVTLDPTGAWWGLRSSADGERAGLPVVVIGGQHADLPLERGAGAFIADLVLDYPGWYVLDLSLLESRSAEREFATAFAERLLRRKMQPGMDFPLHLFVDEADMFIPQERDSGDARMLGAFQGIVRRGGLHGLGATLISQRPALVNKSVLTQLDLLILLRLVAGNDQDAVDKNYISRASTKAQRSELMESLASMPVGEAWFFEPGAEPEPLFTRAKVRERHTFNSSATPKPGEQRVEPRVLADVDLDQLREQMSETIERLKDDDPAELRKRIAELQGRVEARREGGEPGNVDALPGWVGWFRARGWLPPEEQPEPERVEVPVASIEDLDSIWKLVERLHAVAQPLAAAILQAAAAEEAKSPTVGTPRPAEPEMSAAGIVADKRRREAAPAPPEPEPVPAQGVPAEGVTASQQNILDALAWWDVAGIKEPSVGQIAFVVGKHPRSKGFTNNLSALSSADLIHRTPGRATLSADGRATARYPSSAPSNDALQRMLFEQVGPKRAEILRHLIAAGRGAFVSMDDLAAAMESHPRAKGFTNNVSSLSGLGLAVREPGRVRAADLCWIR